MDFFADRHATKVIGQWVYRIGHHELIQSMLMPSFLGHKDRAQPFFNSSLRLAFGLVKLLGARQSGIFNSFD